MWLVKRHLADLTLQQLLVSGYRRPQKIWKGPWCSNLCSNGKRKHLPDNAHTNTLNVPSGEKKCIASSGKLPLSYSLFISGSISPASAFPLLLSLLIVLLHFFVYLFFSHFCHFFLALFIIPSLLLCGEDVPLFLYNPSILSPFHIQFLFHCLIRAAAGC